MCLIQAAEKVKKTSNISCVETSLGPIGAVSHHTSSVKVTSTLKIRVVKRTVIKCVGLCLSHTNK